jgi:hypothetical protein
MQKRWGGMAVLLHRWPRSHAPRNEAKPEYAFIYSGAGRKTYTST